MQTLLFPRFEQGRLLGFIIFTASWILASFLVLTGQLVLVIALIALAWAIWIAYRYPIFIAGFVVLQSIDFFRLIHYETLIKWQLAPGLRINTLDAVVIFSLPIAIFRLLERREKPLFVGPITLIIGVAFLNLALGLVLGTTNLDFGMGLLRIIFYYTAYFILISAVDSPRRLKYWIGFLYAIFLISIVLQIIEAITGQRLTLGLGEYYVYSSDSRLLIGGYQVLYLWNRAPLLAFLVLFMGLGAFFQGRQQKFFWFIITLGIGSLFLAFVRQWYAYLSVGILTLLIIQTKRRFRNLVLTVLIIIFLLALLMIIGPVLQNAFGPSFLNAWLARFDSLIHFQTAENFIIRVQIIKTQWKMFLKSPLIGYGMSPSFREKMSYDTGITNMLVQFGLLGLVAVLVLIVSFFKLSFKILRYLTPSIERGYTSGLIALWVCIFIGSLFSVNYFTRMEGIWMIVIILALLDRVRAFVPSCDIQGKIGTSKSIP